MDTSSIKFILALFAILAAPSAHAQDAFDNVVSTIIDNNATLKGQLKTISAEQLENADNNALANPEISFGRVWGSDGVGNKLDFGISQEILWPWLYGERSKAAKLATLSSTKNYENAKIELRAQVIRQLIELVYTRKQIEAATTINENVTLLKESIEKGFNGGELTIIDLKKAELAGYEISNTLKSLYSLEQQIISALSGMSLAPLDLSGITYYPVEQTHSLEEYLSMADSSSAVSELEAIAEQENQNAKVAKMSRFPSFNVGFQHQTELGDHFNGFTFGMNLPIFEGRHARKAAIERKAAAEIAQEGIKAKQSSEIESTYKNLQICKEQIENYDKIFGDNKYLEYVLKAYKGGQISVLDYIRELQYYNELTQTRLEIEYNYHIYVSALDRYDI